MKGRTILIGLNGWCGFGWQGGELPDLRLGLVRLSWCRGWIGLRIQAWRQALQNAIRGVGA